MIKNLLFDLGGVIMDIERSRCVRSFEKLGLKDADSMLGLYGQQGAFAALESGTITAQQWRDDIRSHIDKPVSDAMIDSAFMDFLTGIPVKRLEQLRSLRQRYGIYMLSNTNPVMWDAKIAAEFRKEGLEREDYFDGMITSFDAKAMKPDKAIFDYAAHTLGIDPAQTLFLDDSADNCRAALKLGWHAAVVAPGDEFADVVTRYLEQLQ